MGEGKFSGREQALRKYTVLERHLPWNSLGGSGEVGGWNLELKLL
jgi:hypothetical protein